MTASTITTRPTDNTAALPATMSVAQWDQDARGDLLRLPAYHGTLSQGWAYNPNIFEPTRYYEVAWFNQTTTRYYTLDDAVAALNLMGPITSKPKTAKTMRGDLIPLCPACNSSEVKPRMAWHRDWERVCGHCGCHYGRTTLAESYAVAHGPMTQNEPELDNRAVPFDFLFRDEQGRVDRRHGFFDPQTGRITQIG